MSASVVARAYTGLGQPWNMKRERAHFRERLAKCRRSGATTTLRGVREQFPRPRLETRRVRVERQGPVHGLGRRRHDRRGPEAGRQRGHRLAASGVRSTSFDDLRPSALKRCCARTVDTLSVVLEALSGALLSYRRGRAAPCRARRCRAGTRRGNQSAATRHRRDAVSVTVPGRWRWPSTASVRQVVDFRAQVLTHCRAWQLNERHCSPQPRRAHGREQARRARSIRRGPGQGLEAELGLLAAAHE